MGVVVCRRFGSGCGIEGGVAWGDWDVGEGVEEKELRVSVAKTVVVKCRVVKGQAGDSGKCPCGVCGGGVGGSSVRCTVCKRWVCEGCGGLRCDHQKVVDFVCRGCAGACWVCWAEIGREGSVWVEFWCCSRVCGEFCYLGNMVGGDGGVGRGL